MDKTKFQEHAPGELVAIETPDPDWAFVPAPLPRDWTLPGDLVHLLVSARESLARLDGAARYLPGNSILIRPLQQREALRSSALEGTFATAEELLAYGLEPKPPTSSSDPVNSWREVFNYDAALQHGQERLKTLPLSSRVFKELHAKLLNGVRGTDRTPGEYRIRQVHIGSDRRFVPPPPEQIQSQIADLERYMNESQETDCLIQSFLAHYQFETIHPFLDGNGRVGRLLLALMIYTKCGMQSPWLYLSPYFERYKDEYIDRLFAVSTKGDWAGWVEFCLRATDAEAKDALRRIDKLLSLRAEYESRIAAAGSPARLRLIAGSLLGTPITTIPGIAKSFNVSFPTAQKDVRKLMELNILTQSERSSKPKYFLSPGYLEAAYGDT
jgi:Fic family protein